MSEYISINIPNKDCKGMFLLADSNLKSIVSVGEANKLIGKTFKIQLRTRVDGQRGKKTFSFESNKITFLKAIELVAGERTTAREILKTTGTLRKQKTVEEIAKIQKTFLEEIEPFLAIKSIEVRFNTIEVYKTALNNHAKPLHDKYMDEITISDIQSIISELTQTRAPATVSVFGRTIRVFLRDLKAPVVLEWEKLKFPEVDNIKKYTLKLEDTKKIIACMRNYSGTTVNNETFYVFEEIRNIFAFLLTGRRINEVIGLKYSDINFEDRTYTIPSSRAKGKAELKFNIDDNLLEVIHSQARINNINLTKELPNKVLFDYCRETPRYHFQNLLVSMGLPKLRLHDIRHMLASTLIQNKVPIADVSVMLGHSSIKTTEQRYANKSADQASRATDALNDLMRGI